MFRVICWTQDEENYGTPEKPYWKFKGGTEFVIGHLTVEDVNRIMESGKTLSEVVLGEMLPKYLDRIEVDNEMFSATVVGWDLFDGFTWMEESQLEYEGFIEYPAHDLTADSGLVCPVIYGTKGVQESEEEVSVLED